MKKVPLQLTLLSLGFILLLTASERRRIHSSGLVDWPLIQETPAARFTNDIRIIELVPSTSILFHGEKFTTNRWGMRDQEYELIPPAGTYRILFFGSSIVMGSGVADNEVFESLLEEKLNREFGGRSYAHYEILNFGVASHASLQSLYVLEQTAIQFKPNAVFLVTHQQEETDFIPGLADRIRMRVDILFSEINEIVQRAGIEEGLSGKRLESLLLPYSGEFVSWVYQCIVNLSKEKGFLPVWVILPTIEFPESDLDYKISFRRAEEAGFVTVDLSDIYIRSRYPFT